MFKSCWEERAERKKQQCVFSIVCIKLVHQHLHWICTESLLLSSKNCIFYCDHGHFFALHEQNASKERRWRHRRNKEKSEAPKGLCRRQETGRGTALRGRRGRRSWHCLFGNSRPPGPRGMLMREGPFSGGCRVGGVEAGVGSSHGYQTS